MNFARDPRRRPVLVATLYFLAICVFPVCVVAMEGLSSSSSDERVPVISREKTIETTEGERNRIRTEGKILDVSVTRPEVAEAFVVEPQELILTSNSPGVGKCVVRLDAGETIAYRIRVYVADPQGFVQELKKEIGHIPGISIEVLKDKILIDGRALYLKDLDVIERAVGDNPSIINLVSLSSRNVHILAREIQMEFRASGIYGASVEVRDNTVTLVGALGSESLVRKAHYIASTYTPSFESFLIVHEKEDDSTRSD